MSPLNRRDALALLGATAGAGIAAAFTRDTGVLAALGQSAATLASAERRPLKCRLQEH